MYPFEPNDRLGRRISVSSILIQILESTVISSLVLRVVQLPQACRRAILIISDVALSLLSIYTVLGVRLNNDSLPTISVTYANAIFLVVLIRLSSFYIFGHYRQLLRYFNNSILGLTLKSIAFSEVASQIIFSFIGLNHLPRSVRLVSGLTYVLLIVISRLTITQILSASDSRAISKLDNLLPMGKISPKSKSIPVIIYGAGAAGFILNHLLTSEQHYKVVAFFDDNPNFHGRMVTSTPVYPPSYLGRIIRQFKIQEAFIAMPSADINSRRRIVQDLKSLSLEIKTVPSVSEIVSGRFSLNQVRTVDITDLLGREEVMPHPNLLQADVKGKVVLVTGAGGSIGSELCRQIANQEPSCIVFYELNEFALYSIDIELAETYPSLKRIPCLGSVTESGRLENLMRDYAVETVYHAAAYKHVPLVEANPSQGIINNIQGTLSAAQSAISAGVKTFVLISTDKAVRPTNVMGASKRAAELVLQALSERNNIPTRFSMVRFGNVLDSSGSVVPRFRKQIADRQAITVTHRDITRYFMSIPEAARLVIQAGAMAKGGEVFLLDMGEPIRIYDLAVQMIELSGLHLGKDIDIQITGLRPGEKLYEELLIDSTTAVESAHPKIYCANEAMLNWKDLEVKLKTIFAAAERCDHQAVISLLKELVPEYTPAVLNNKATAASGVPEIHLVTN